MRLAVPLILLALAACASLKTIADATPLTRLHAANVLYATTADKAAAYGRNCQAKPTTVCVAIVNRAQAADRIANSARVKANDAFNDGGNTDLAFLVGAAEGAIEGFATYYP